MIGNKLMPYNIGLLPIGVTIERSIEWNKGGCIQNDLKIIFIIGRSFP